MNHKRERILPMYIFIVWIFIHLPISPSFQRRTAMGANRSCHSRGDTNWISKSEVFLINTSQRQHPLSCRYWWRLFDADIAIILRFQFTAHFISVERKCMSDLSILKF